MYNYINERLSKLKINKMCCKEQDTKDFITYQVLI